MPEDVTLVRGIRHQGFNKLECGDEFFLVPRRQPVVLDLEAVLAYVAG